LFLAGRGDGAADVVDCSPARRRDGAGSRVAGAAGGRRRAASGAPFMTLLRQQPKYRRRLKKPLAFEDDSHK